MIGKLPSLTWAVISVGVESYDQKNRLASTPTFDDQLALQVTAGEKPRMRADYLFGGLVAGDGRRAWAERAGTGKEAGAGRVAGAGTGRLDGRTHRGTSWSSTCELPYPTGLDSVSLVRDPCLNQRSRSSAPTRH